MPRLPSQRVLHRWSYSIASIPEPETPARRRSAPANASPRRPCASPPMARSMKRTALLGLARSHLSAADSAVDPMLLQDPERPVRPRRRPLRARSGQGTALRAAADLRSPGEAPRGRDRSDERRAVAAALVRPAGRVGRRPRRCMSARTVSRRAERLMVELASLPDEPVERRRRSSTSIACPIFCSSRRASSTTAARRMCSGCRARIGRAG